MSLASWKMEFYNKPASKVRAEYSVKHSLKKWIGLLKKNMKRHQVTRYTVPVGASTCALCHHFLGSSCVACPIFLKTGLSCSERGSAYNSWCVDGKAIPMVRILTSIDKKGIPKK